jgi:RNA polymerase sigma factor (sigma-70 family)
MAAKHGNTTQIQDCLERLRAGDEAARDELFQWSSDRLFRLARKLRGTYPSLRHCETDDVFQDAMLRLHKALKDISPDNVRDWTGLAGLQIRRVLLDTLRHQRGPEGTAANVQTGGIGGDGSTSSPGREPAAGTAGPATLAQWTEFHELVDRLPPEFREVFHQHYYYGLSEAETGEVLGVSVETVKRRWRAAKIRLAALLGGQPPGL